MRIPECLISQSWTAGVGGGRTVLRFHCETSRATGPGQAEGAADTALSKNLLKKIFLKKIAIV